MNITNGPEAKVALQFSELVVESKYKEAASLLVNDANQFWDADYIRDRYTQMINYFKEVPEVIGNHLMEVFEDEKGKYIYVPIQGELTSEAITVGVNKEHRIFSIELGRP